MDIERHYRIAIRAAKKRVWIANAYFFPGYRLLKQMRRAARRGVDVRLILQGCPDMAIVKFGARLLYHHLLRRFPSWAGLLPAHVPTLTRAQSRLPDGRRQVVEPVPERGVA